MMQEFLSSWGLFGTTYVVGMSSAATLALVGVWVVAQNKIFLGAAVAQASTLGVAGALWFGAHVGGSEWLESHAVLDTVAVAASIITAWLATRRVESGYRSAEETIGWIFLLSASIPVLLVAHSPHGLEEIQRLLFSTLLVASTLDAVLFALLLTGAALAAWRLFAPLLLLALDPDTAAAVGLRTARWNLALALGLGVVVGLSIRTGGMLYTFGCLVLPALIAKSLCREVRPMLLASPAIGLTASLIGFYVSFRFDLPPAHVTVGVLSLGLALGWGIRGLRSGAERETLPSSS
jgi:ABC-type Mn2+/Zn2+ transport system permease subunit